MIFNKVRRVSTLDELREMKFEFEIVPCGRYIKTICQNIITFDTETSNGFRLDDGTVIGFDHDKYNNNPELYDNAEKQSLMYSWQFGIESKDHIKIFMGRTWEEFLIFTDELLINMNISKMIGDSTNTLPDTTYNTMRIGALKGNTTLYIYIHNLSFDYQQLRNVFESEFSSKRSKIAPVFARSLRKPMRARIKYNTNTLIFGDSYVLTQKSLKNWCKDAKLPVSKLDEPPEYYLPIRTPLTPLTSEEIDYQINDVESMIYGLIKYREKYGSLQEIPMTQTGEVRRTCISQVVNNNHEWACKCAGVTVNYSLELFQLLTQMFMGGWTHANSMYTSILLHNVKAYDLASSYPTVMCTRTFPIGDFFPVNNDDFYVLEKEDIYDLDKDFHWFAKLKLKEVSSKLSNTFWSSSKCLEIDGEIVDNGKIYYADNITIVITDVDWNSFKRFYDYSEIEIIEVHKAEAGLLPIELILLILDYYGKKTSLKGVSDSEYSESKQFINSIYGVSVTRIVTDIIEFNKGWSKIELTEEMFYEQIMDTDVEKTFLSYQNGVWVTAWAKNRLVTGIEATDKHLAYGDTDSLKGVFDDKDLQWFDDDNAKLSELEQEIANRLNFDVELFYPKTPNGVKSQLGIWDREDDCIEFKTLGAKRYVYSVKDGNDIKVKCTIAGLPKQAGVNKIKNVDDFKNDVKWNTTESMKNIHFYNDNQSDGIWIDRDGVPYTATNEDNKFGCCIMPTTFDLSLSDEYVSFLETLNGDTDKITEVSDIIRK